MKSLQVLGYLYLFGITNMSKVSSKRFNKDHIVGQNNSESSSKSRICMFQLVLHKCYTLIPPLINIRMKQSLVLMTNHHYLALFVILDMKQYLSSIFRVQTMTVWVVFISKDMSKPNVLSTQTSLSKQKANMIIRRTSTTFSLLWVWYRNLPSTIKSLPKCTAHIFCKLQRFHSQKNFNHQFIHFIHLQESQELSHSTAIEKQEN